MEDAPVELVLGEVAVRGKEEGLEEALGGSEPARLSAVEEVGMPERWLAVLRSHPAAG